MEQCYIGMYNVEGPAYDISEEQLSFLLERAFNVRDISSILGVSVRTVERRMSSFWLSVTGKLIMKKFVNFRKCNLEINIIKVKNLYIKGWFI